MNVDSLERKYFKLLGPLLIAILFSACASPSPTSTHALNNYVLDYNSPTNPALQSNLAEIDVALRAKYGMTTEQTAVGVLDLKRLQLAMIHPDRIEYAASVPKVGILLAYFQLHPEAATNLATQRDTNWV